MHPVGILKKLSSYHENSYATAIIVYEKKKKKKKNLALQAFT